MQQYETPMLTYYEWSVEQGFATSGGATIEDGTLDNWGDY